MEHHVELTSPTARGMPIKTQCFGPDRRLPSAALIGRPSLVTPAFQLHVLLVEPARDEREMRRASSRAWHTGHLRRRLAGFDLAGTDHPHVVVIEPVGATRQIGIALIRAFRADPRPQPSRSWRRDASHERAAALAAGVTASSKPCAGQSELRGTERIVAMPPPTRERAAAAQS